MNLSKISLKFFKLAQQLNINREEEEIPEKLLWTESPVGLDTSKTKYINNRNRDLYPKTLFPYLNSENVNFKVDLEKFQLPKFTQEFVEQIYQNILNTLNSELNSLKIRLNRSKDDDLILYYEKNIKVLEREKDSFVNSKEEWSNEILRLSEEYSSVLRNLKNNYLKAKHYVAKYEHFVVKKYSKIQDFLIDLPEILNAYLFKFLGEKYFVYYDFHEDSLKIENFYDINAALKSRISKFSHLNERFEAGELNIKKYTDYLANFIENYLSRPEVISNLTFLNKNVSSAVDNIFELLKTNASTLTDTHDFISNLDDYLNRHINRSTVGSEIISDTENLLNSKYYSNLLDQFDNLIYENLNKILYQFMLEMEKFSVKYKNGVNGFTVELDNNFFNFLKENYGINLESILNTYDNRFTFLSFSKTFDSHSFFKFLIKNGINLNEEEITRSLQKYFLDLIKNRIYSQIEHISFTNAKLLLEYGGGFDTQSIFNLLKNLFPGINKSELSALYKSIIAGEFSIHNDKSILNIRQKMGPFIYMLNKIENIHLVAKVLKKENKLNVHYIKHFFSNLSEINTKIYSISFNAPQSLKDSVLDLASNFIRNYETIQSDLDGFNEIIEMFHNEANYLKKEQYINILNNPNINNFHKIVLAKKFITFYASFKSSKGFDLLKANKDNIKHLLNIKAIYPGFEDNIKQVIDFIESKSKITTNLNYDLIKALNRAETDYQFIKDSSVYKKLFNSIEPKDPNIYNLNYQINNNLRFRALKEKDPRHLRIGIETDCCQRVGGAAESCVVDSFVNSLAGILILEKQDDSGNWNLLCQSYFHYVPEDNGFILDNIEASRLAKSMNNLDLAKYYHELSIHAKQAGYSYLLAGKGYSDINTEYFTTSNMDRDNRTYHNDRSVYSDYKHEDGMDLSKINA